MLKTLRLFLSEKNNKLILVFLSFYLCGQFFVGLFSVHKTFLIKQD